MSGSTVKDPVASGSGEGQAARQSVRRKPVGKEAKEIVLNVYRTLRTALPQTKALKQCATLTGMSITSCYRIVQEQERTGRVDVPQTHLRGRKTIELDEDSRRAIRRTVHSFYLNNELLTIQKILDKVRENDIIPKMGRETLRKALKELQFRYVTRSRKSALIEKPEIVTRNYLRSITELRTTRKIYYLDIMDYLDTSILVSKRTGDYHEDMNAERCEQWFQAVLQRVEPDSVIVMDNASYHSRRSERIPTMSSKKADMQQWLREKGIAFHDTSVKSELYTVIRQHKPANIAYVVDEMARHCGITVLRLPPYHYEFNPIELIWAQTKNYVARHNVTYKLADVERLFRVALEEVTPQAWQKAIAHVRKEEERMWALDIQVERRSSLS